MVKPVLIAIILFIACNLLSAQPLKKDYEVLGKATIIKNSAVHDFYDISEMNQVLLSMAIHNLEEKIKRGNYAYEVKEVDRILTYKIVAIIDKSNLMTVLETVYAINTADSIYRYFEINNDNLVDFINKNIYPEIKAAERFRLIGFYNSLLSYLNSGSEFNLEFFNKENQEKFSPLDNVYRLNNIVTGEQIGKRDYYEHIYRKTARYSDIADFYQVIYKFGCDKFAVEKFLLLRTKI